MAYWEHDVKMTGSNRKPGHQNLFASDHTISYAILFTFFWNTENLICLQYLYLIQNNLLEMRRIDQHYHNEIFQKKGFNHRPTTSNWLMTTIPNACHHSQGQDGAEG